MFEIPTVNRAIAYRPAFATGQNVFVNSRPCPDRKAALLSLCQLNPKDIDHLLALSPGKWRKLLRWLDESGLCLYFAERMNELNLQGTLPQNVSQGLQQNLSNNRVRMRGLLQECGELQVEFQRANVSCALLEGFSLCPASVPMAELRYELDFDFLVDESDASKAREILEQAGYLLHRSGEATWEFKKNEDAKTSKGNMYKDGSRRVVQLHIETSRPGQKSLLSRVEYRQIEGTMMPVLPAAELLLRHGMRIFEDVCNSSLRASHLLEFYRNMCAHADDRMFWSDVRELAGEDPTISFGLGVVLQLIEIVMEEQVPSKLALWTTLRLPVAVQRWVDAEGLRCVYGTARSTKLCMLLRQEWEKAGVSLTVPPRTRLQQAIAQADANDRIPRHARYLLSVLQRLTLQVVEGLRCVCMLYRAQRHRNGLSA